MKKEKSEEYNQLMWNNDFEPKMNYRHIVEFPYDSIARPWIESYVIHSVDLPKWHKGIWQEITMKMYDPISPSTSEAVMRILDNKHNPLCIPFIIKLLTLDPTGQIIEAWEIEVDEITAVDFGCSNWNYGSMETEVRQVTMTVQPKNCKLLKN